MDANVARIPRPQRQRPVVALESTVISHGLPYPANLAIARDMEAAMNEDNSKAGKN